MVSEMNLHTVLLLKEYNIIYLYVELTIYGVFSVNLSSNNHNFTVNSQGTMSMASMWTRKDVREFKESIRREGGEAVLKVGHGETVTVSTILKKCIMWFLIHY